MTLCWMEMIFPLGFFYYDGASSSSLSDRGKNRWTSLLSINVFCGKVHTFLKIDRTLFYLLIYMFT